MPSNFAHLQLIKRLMTHATIWVCVANKTLRVQTITVVWQRIAPQLHGKLKMADLILNKSSCMVLTIQQIIGQVEKIIVVPALLTLLLHQHLLIKQLVCPCLKVLVHTWCKLIKERITQLIVLCK